MATADTPFTAMMTRARRAFRQWRRARPFWGGLLLLLSGLELFLSANLNLGDLKVHFGPQGFLSYVIPAMLILCGALIWGTPQLRLFYGIIGLLVATYSIIGLNVGGFLVGLILGIVGGALSIAWTPAPPAAVAGPDPDNQSEPDADAEPGPTADDDTATLDGLLDAPAPDRPVGKDSQPPIAVEYQVAPERPDAAVRPQAPTPDQTAPDQAPARDQSPLAGRPGADGTGPGARGRHRTQLFAVTLLSGALATALLAAGAPPTRAEAAPAQPTSTECPPAAAAKLRKVPPAGARTAKPRTTPRATRTAAKPAPKPSAGKDTEDPPKGKPSPTPSPSRSASGNPIVDGWNDFVEDVEDFFTGGGRSASPTPSPSGSAEPSATPSPGGSEPSGEPGEPGAPGKPPGQQPRPSPSTTTTPPTVPCLGARQFISAEPDGEPFVAEKPAILTTSSLTMYGSTYDGLVPLRTKGGKSIEVLKFSMNKAVNKPFKLRIPESNGTTTVIDSSELTTEGNVRFYTPKFVGKLFGLIPMEFTPEHPPPLMLPLLWFSDVTIQLTFVRCDTLTADDLKITID